ncbi:MAG: TatD family hydrolase [Gammaproteobacteria bacterium]|nr:TatD family hydrolase [Gammaproteobacteria bacterium]
MYIDSHCHLNLLEFTQELPDLDSVLVQCRVEEIEHLLSVSTRLQDFQELLDIALSHSHISISAGIHPNEEEVNPEEYNILLDQASNKKVIAIGETGLDYYRTEEKQDWQHARFINHIEIAKKLQKPLIIHTRNASEDTIKLLKTHNARDAGGIMHCFTETWEVAKQALDLGFDISLSGIVTFKNATQIHEVAQKVPINRLLIETDCPYLAPVPLRGKANFPQYIKHTAAYIAQLRNIDIKVLANETTQNFYRLFKSD